MAAFDTLRAIAADPLAQLTARQVIEARVGRSLPPTAELPDDLKTAIKLLAIQHIRTKRTAP
jgi:hypothetical protein